MADPTIPRVNVKDEGAVCACGHPAKYHAGAIVATSCMTYGCSCVKFMTPEADNG